jgi:MFS family permease
MSSTSQAVAVGTAEPSSRAAKFGPLTFLLLCLGHFAIDTSSASLGGLQPVFREYFGITLTQAGILGGVFVFSSSLMQPLYGWLADRYETRMFTVLSPLLSSIAVGVFCFAPGFYGLIPLVFLAGVGIAAFHPQGTALAVRGVEHKRGRAMAAFISSGTAGFAIGPSFWSHGSDFIRCRGASFRARCAPCFSICTCQRMSVTRFREAQEATGLQSWKFGSQ